MKMKILAGVLGCGLALQGCGLKDVETPTSLIGPSELGLSLRVLALPDALVADGIQTAVVQAILQDQNGKAVAGRDIIFSIQDNAGSTAEIGTLTSASGARVFGSTSIRTNANGIAQVIYTTPERRDFTADSQVRVGARPVGTDAQGAFLWTVTIDLKSAEPRRFPEGGGGTPTCSFITAPNNPVSPAGTVLRFTSTSFATPPNFIVRYEWYFGDGSGGAQGAEGIIDVQHPFPNAGTYTVTHVVTSNTGAQTTCSKNFTFTP